MDHPSIEYLDENPLDADGWDSGYRGRGWYFWNLSHCIVNGPFERKCDVQEAFAKYRDDLGEETVLELTGRREEDAV